MVLYRFMRPGAPVRAGGHSPWQPQAGLQGLSGVWGRERRRSYRWALLPRCCRCIGVRRWRPRWTRRLQLISKYLAFTMGMMGHKSMKLGGVWVGRRLDAGVRSKVEVTTMLKHSEFVVRLAMRQRQRQRLLVQWKHTGPPHTWGRRANSGATKMHPLPEVFLESCGSNNTGSTAAQQPQRPCKRFPE